MISGATGRATGRSVQACFPASFALVLNNDKMELPLPWTGTIAGCQTVSSEAVAAGFAESLTSPARLSTACQSKSPSVLLMLIGAAGVAGAAGFAAVKD